MMGSVTCRGDLHMAPANLLGSLDIINKVQPEPTVTEISEQCINSNSPLEPLSSEMDTSRVKRIDPPNFSPESSTHPSRHGSSTATSVQHSRSASRSTARSRPPSRHSSFHSTRQPAMMASIVPVPSMRTASHEKRESLLALHRESCRLFEEHESADNIRPTLQRTCSTTYRSLRESRTSSDICYSAPPSPIASSQSSRRDYEHRRSLSSATSPPFHPRDRSSTLPSITNQHTQSSSASSIHIPATVMEWTSDTTRRREYEKIDRASRGVRGLWRRVAPRWCHRDSRTPFFEEGKTTREGSVRRFRMDIPDEECHDSDGYARRWTYHRSKTTPN